MVIIVLLAPAVLYRSLCRIVTMGALFGGRYLLQSCEGLLAVPCETDDPVGSQRLCASLTSDFEHSYTSLNGVVPPHIVLERCVDVACFR